MRRSHVVFMCGCIAALSPHLAHASVVINEFLYDAAGSDTDQEYVELYNNGSSSVDLTKYKINDGSNHTLNVPPKNGGTGSLSIPAGGYVLLVDNATNFLAAHSSISGAVIDTVLSLSNTGATITLVDDTGATADSVSYTKDQGANGDGNTLQRTGAIWIAAAPTPLAANASSASAPSADQEDAGSGSSSTSSSPSSASNSAVVSSYVAPPAPEIFADGGADRTVIVGADTAFHARAYNKKQDLVENVRFNWNFGDGTTDEGIALMHHFEYPGKYVVVLNVAAAVSTAADRIVVTAEPANLAFVVNSDGSVSISNKAGKDIDVSKWIIKSFARTFIFPENSDILAGQTLRLSSATLGFTVGPQTELEYPNGTRVEPAPVAPATNAARVAKEEETVMPTATAPARTGERPSEGSNSEEISTVVPPETALPEAASSSQLATAASTGAYSWWLGAFLIGLLACAALFFVRRVQKGEWNIIEES